VREPQGWSTWAYEAIAFYLALPSSGGRCAKDETTIYRLYNNGVSGAPNHRYTSAPSVVAAMQAKGWLLEGSAITGVFACGPTAPSAGAAVVRVTSTANGRPYDVAIYVPEGYDESSAPVPVVYALDAQIRYQSLLAAVKSIGTKVILVQIYDMGMRQTDFNVPGAYAFLKFLTRDLIPYVEMHYRADPRKRAISGLSSSGNFPFHAIYYEAPGPWTFAHYWSTEGAFWQQQEIVDTEEAKLYDLIGRAPLPVTFALAGGSPNGPNVKRLYDAIALRNYNSLRLLYLPYPFGHVETDVPALIDELRMLCGSSNCRGSEH
jgi:predicted alpha/beta superfamily hydrolase